MRTTLKKGIGGSANGNGAYPPEAPFAPDPPLRVSAAPPPRLPPGPGRLDGGPSGPTYYRTRRHPFRVLGKLVMWLVVAVLVAAGALAGGVKLYFDYSVAALVATSPEAVAAAKELDAAPAAGEPATAIVIGYDKRAGETAAGSRSDTVMLLRAHPDKNAVTLLSFPRDLIVDIPGCTGHPAWTGRINEAYSYCGPRGTLLTVKELTGVPINYMITVNFRAFRTIVDRLGGVYMDVDQRYHNDNEGLGLGQTYARINLKPGYQHLNGRAALDFVRFRHTDSDLYRVVRQQEFVKAFKQQVSSNWSLFQLPGIVKTITENVEVAKGGNEALNSDEVISYARLVYGLPAGNFQQVSLENVSGYNELAVSETDLADAVRRFMNPDVEAPEKALDVATGQQPKGPQAPPPSEVSVEVQNGNGVAGAADEAAYLLGQIGYPTSNGGNAPTFDYFHTSVRYDPSVEGAEQAAQQLADLFGDADVEAARAALPTMIRVIVGKTFTGTLGPAPEETTPEREPPAVVRDPGSVIPLLRPLRKQVNFPIMVPHVREESSSFASESPVRIYRLEEHMALRLTYSTATNEYWGVQQTSWLDAPILNGPTLERRIGGRVFKLYFSGQKLHMIAFEDGGAAYWVVNTLQNRLSNETMIAIARGLRPLPAPK
jgi:LCP family protein required for cell wall assembly